MSTASTGQVTHLLRAWSDGDPQAMEHLLPLVEAELRRLARGYMSRERREHTLQPTALINEAFIRLAGATSVRWQDRAHFFGIAARLMRRVLVDHARSRGFQKRGAGAERISLHDSIPTPEPVRYRLMFGAFGQARNSVAATFVSRLALDRKKLPRGNDGLDRIAAAAGGNEEETEGDADFLHGVLSRRTSR